MTPGRPDRRLRRTMKRTLTAALAAATATAGIAFATSAHGAGGTTLHLVNHDAGFAYQDVKPKQLPKKGSLGDTLTIAGRLTGDRKGTSALVCTVTQAGKGGNELCQGIAYLSDGTIVFSGRSNQDDSPSPLAVTGGTGAYAGAGGTITTTDGKHNTTLVTIALEG